jgi:hypothetical protein
MSLGFHIITHLKTSLESNKKKRPIRSAFFISNDVLIVELKKQKHLI